MVVKENPPELEELSEESRQRVLEMRERLASGEYIVSSRLVDDKTVDELLEDLNR